MKLKLNFCVALAAAACTALPVSVSQAQSGDDSLALEEIIVSARKRDESLQDVPIAVSVFSAPRLEQLSINNVQDLARFTPSLTFDQGVLPMDTRPVIRGASALRGRPNVATLVDFVDVSSEALTVAGGGISTNLRLLDVERVEIVKGPQSALYGRSAFTGAVNYVTKRPSETLETDVMVAYDEHATSEFRASVSGPILDDKLGARVIFSNFNRDGWYNNPNTGGQLGALDSIGGALSLEWQMSEKVTSFFRWERSHDEATPRPEAFVQAITPEFDPMINFLATGTVTDAATQFPHLFDMPYVCNAGDRLQPNWDTFANQGVPLPPPPPPPCRALVTGEMHATGADIDLSADPRTGRDFLGSDVRNTRIHFDIDFDLDKADFKYILGYNSNNAFVQEDFDKSDSMIFSNPFGPFAFSQYGLSAMSQQKIDTHQWNHELRLSGDNDKFTWMLSLLHWSEQMDSQFDDEWWLRDGGDPGQVLALLNMGPFSYLNGIPPFVPPFCQIYYPTDPNCVNQVTTIATGPGDTPYIPLQRETKHTSLAGMISMNLSDSVILSLEGRFLTEKIDYAGGSADVSFYSQFGADPYWGFQFGPGEMTYNTIEEDAFVPKVTLDWAVNDSMLLYGYYSQAFKPGGVSTTDANGDVSTGEYKSEKLDAYEIGMKSDFRDGSIRFNAAAFFYDYTDQQVPYQFVSPTTALLQTGVVNAGETEIKGAEFDLTWNSAFFEGFSANVSYTYTDAEFTSFNLTEILAEVGSAPSTFNRVKAGNADADFSGKVPPLTPEHAATVSLRYDTNFDGGRNTFVELIGIYSSERFIGEDNLSWLPDYTTLDLYMGIAGGKWGLTFFVQNLTNDDKIKSGLGNVDYAILPDFQSVPQGLSLYLPQPRTAGARLTYSFGSE